MLGPATLMGYRVAIGRAGYGTLIPDDHARVHGVLWQLTDQDEAALDQFEAVDQGIYHKACVTVRRAGSEDRAMVYLAVDGSPGVANPDYVRQVVAAARASGLPVDYVDSLTRLPQDESTEPWVPPVARVRN